LYRDLKPENILIDEDGYIKLADFGLAKNAVTSNTFCGTPAYISPEMLLGNFHDHTTDWWSLGILIYEMLTGIPTFYDQDRNKMFYRIEFDDIIWPLKEKHGFQLEPAAMDLISKLLIKDKN
jgi:serine/threonine protein kinase